MSLLARLLGSRRDDRAKVRALWHRVVEMARAREWYADCGVADTIAGRFDAITLVLCIVLLRMEQSPALVEPSVRLTELFVDDMDGQLRESGVGDVIVGKHMGRLMSTLGGRLGAYREALASDDDALLGATIDRNVTLNEGANPLVVAARARTFAARIAALPDAAVLAGELPA